jgi:hypothetical protein
MIGRLISFVGGALLYFSLATLIAEAVMAGYVWSKWNLDRDKIAQLVAIARGLEPAAPPPAAPAPPRDEAAAEQVAFNQVMELRAMKDKNIELREQALADAVGKLRVDQQKLADDDKRYRLDRADYESKLAAAAKGAKTTGQEEVRRILLAIKPKQAKEFLQAMLDNKELDEVVSLLSGMADGRRAKILGEFKTPEDTKKIEEVLRQIRKGVPEAPLARQAMDKLQADAPPGQ